MGPTISFPPPAKQNLGLAEEDGNHLSIKKSLPFLPINLRGERELVHNRMKQLLPFPHGCDRIGSLPTKGSPRLIRDQVEMDWTHTGKDMFVLIHVSLYLHISISLYLNG